MRERLGYYMYRNFELLHLDLTTPSYINDVFSGVYANTENIVGPFTNKHFDDMAVTYIKKFGQLNQMAQNRKK